MSYNSYNYEELKSSPVLDFALSATISYRVILTESGLSFLGLGMGPDTVTLGSLLAQAKENMDAWWLMLFPGVFLFVTILSLFNLGNQNNLSGN